MVREMATLLRILARHNPHLWEAIAPHVPKEWLVGAGQDLAQGRLHVERALQLEVRETVRLVAEAALSAASTGQLDLAQRLVQEVDGDWCGTGWPKRWPKPGPRVELFLLESPKTAWPVVQAAGALGFGAYAASIEDPKLAAVFAESADRLADAALGGRR